MDDENADEHEWGQEDNERDRRDDAAYDQQPLPLFQISYLLFQVVDAICQPARDQGRRIQFRFRVQISGDF